MAKVTWTITPDAEIEEGYTISMVQGQICMPMYRANQQDAAMWLLEVLEWGEVFREHGFPAPPEPTLIDEKPKKARSRAATRARK